MTCAGAASDKSRRLTAFAEERYLHQTFGITKDGLKLSMPDLTAAHALNPPPEWLDCTAWRIHYHVPIHLEQMGPFRTTRAQLRGALTAVGRLDYVPQLEVETYTWPMLPDLGGTGQPLDLLAGLRDELECAYAIVADLGCPVTFER